MRVESEPNGCSVASAPSTQQLSKVSASNEIVTIKIGTASTPVTKQHGQISAINLCVVVEIRRINTCIDG
jgi:hypothetical protein